MPLFLLLLVGWCTLGASSANKLLLVHEANETELSDLFVSSLPSGVSVSHRLTVDHEQDSDETPLCDALSSEGPFAAVVDLSWGGWVAGRRAAAEGGVPYVHVEASNKPFVMGMDSFLYARDAIDAALLFETETELDQSLYHIIGNYRLRVLVLSRAEDDPFQRMDNLRPIPSAFVAFGTTQQLTDTLKEAQKRSLIKRNSRWNFVVEDFDAENFATSGTGDVDVVIVSMKAEVCCGLTEQTPGSNPSSCLSQCQTKPKQLVVKKAAAAIGRAARSLPTHSYSCSPTANSNATAADFLTDIRSQLDGSNYMLDAASSSLGYPVELRFRLENKTSGKLEDMGTWTEKGGMAFSQDFVDRKIPRFFRVGMAPAVPWLFEKTDGSGNVMKDKDDQTVYEGYCMDLLAMIAKKLNFDYEIVITNETRPGYTYGRKLDNGEWTGMIGDLANGETDLIVADLTMTSEREEVIDFVSPYFDQAGISIVLRKKLREQSLFKFLSVLKTEVWLGIVAAVIVTAILIWLLDRYSPYSARNNRAAYPYPCRDFTLKESFWFALTSLTPQGGGEAPKALSGRVLVAAYWLFVVLMLATFTANLAAFLTVERMQTTVQSLEELARQSRINYTVVKDTSYMEYFVNMAGAEEELYHKWKELTLNSSGNPAKYRVWDYPIREQYTHILKVINETGPVGSTKEGFGQVLEHTNGDYAFIHDAARIRYEVYNNCNLTEVGEPFAEQPYALAVQQGSHLQEELSRVILELQKDRYFESLQSQYWNSSSRNDCPILDDSDGITLQSLGGVFIATLIGLALALLTLAVEVVLQKRKEGSASNKVQGLNGSDAKRAGSVDPHMQKRGMPTVIGH